MVYKTLIILMLLVSTCFSGEIQKISLPKEVEQEIQVDIDDEISNKVWNRWTSENFVVCSLNNEQAKYLNINLEKVKSWIYNRWGMPDVKFQAECRLVCVDDKQLFKKMFGLTESKVEIRRDSFGKIKMSVIFILLDKKPAHTIPIPLTQVCLAELEQQYNFKLGWWANRGISLLNGNLEVIKKDLKKIASDLEKDEFIFFTKSLVNISESDYYKLDRLKKDKVDQASVALVLLLRKEFGQDKFLSLIRKAAPNPEAAFLNVYKFDHTKLDALYKSYIISLGKDLNNNITPYSYLQIQSK